MDEEEIILKAKHLHTILRNDTNCLLYTSDAADE